MNKLTKTERETFEAIGAYKFARVPREELTAIRIEEPKA